MKEIEGMRLIQAKEEFGNENVNKAFEVQINGKMFDVYSIDENKNQGIRKESLWVDYLEHGLISYNDGMHKICWGVVYEQFNKAKKTIGGIDFQDKSICYITANGKKIYEFEYSTFKGSEYDLKGALDKACILIEKIKNHPFNFLNPEKEKGRKIWYYGLPATIELFGDFGMVNIVPDLSFLSIQEWFYKLIKRTTKLEKEPTLYGKSPFSVYECPYEGIGTIRGKDVLTETGIDWFRKN